MLVAQKAAAKDEPAADDMYEIGCVATILQMLKLPDGTVKVLVEGAQRARIARVIDDGDALRRRGRRRSPPRPATTHEVEAMRRAVLAAVRPVRQAQQEDPARDPDLARRHRRRRPPGRHHRRAPAAQARAEAVSARAVRRRQAPRAPARRSSKREVDILQVEKRIRGRVKRQMEKSQREYYLNEQVKAIQKELGEGEEGADLEEIEKKIKAAQDAQGGAQEGRGRAQEAQADVADVGRSDRRAQLHRHAGRPAVEEEDQDQHDLAQRREGARRRPLRPREGQGAHPRIPRGAAARRQGEGADPVPRRPARRRQDLARPVDRARDQPQVRAHGARRRARRGRDPRPSPHLHRLDAGQDPAEPDQGRRAQSAVPARRDRQDGHGLPRRPVVGAARGARPGAEPHLRRPLRRGRVRPVRRDVRRDRRTR